MSHHLLRSTRAAVLAGLGTLALLLATSQPAVSADTTPPPTPENLRLVGRTPDQVGFVWTTPATQATPRYELSFPGGRVVVDQFRTWATAPLAGLDLSPGRSYGFELRAVDAAGNRSVVPARFTFETTPPGAATGLRQLSTRAGLPELVRWDAAPDDGGIQGYDIVLNGEVIGTTGRTAPEVDLFDLIVNVACIDPPSGPATLQVRAVDTSFNSGPLSAPLTLQFP